ncbi:uncharacterized protein LOC132263466 isoform X2 [Phlebotomus argentipes]|uniref:uncharacterized protein LOC132263466 isoform X2 n=1 Tax=Phlebotomus argentipes TaxID=94469 RepID=UPI0028934DBC|nr:uncharacterized protein LOC132263466 isoform X2 [Phlebotomus argentipes]
MRNAEEEIHSDGQFGYAHDNSGVVEIMGEVPCVAEDVVTTVDFNETAISKLLDAVQSLSKIQQTQKRIADILDLTEDEESENDVDCTVTFPLKSLKQFQSLERMSNNEAYRKNLTKSLRLLLINGPIQDPVKNLLDDSIAMHFVWDDLSKPYLISLRQTICFGHVIYNALGMCFSDYSNFVRTCLSMAQARSQNRGMSSPITIRPETQFQHFAYLVTDISQRISDVEIFQKKIESYTDFKKHELDHKIYFPLNSITSLQMLESALRYKVIQDEVISYCRELYKKDRSLQSIVLSQFLAEFSIAGPLRKSDIFKFSFFNHSLYVALEMTRQDYEIEITHEIECASEKVFGKSSKLVKEDDVANQEIEAIEKAHKIVTERKIVLIKKEDLTEQGIPKMFRDVLMNRSDNDKATIFTDSKNFISFAKIDSASKTVSKDFHIDNIEEKVSRYFPLTSQKALRQFNIKLSDQQFKFSMQYLLDEFYYNRKFSIKDIIADDLLANVNELELFGCFLMSNFLPLILSLPPKSFLRMAKLEFRALKTALELKRINHNEFIRVKMEIGQTIEVENNINGTVKQYFPIATIEEFDDIERNLEYPDFYKEISHHCKIVLMKEKKFKLKNFVAENLLTKYSAKGSASTLSLIETKLFGDILRQFSKLSEADFTSIVQKHHSIVMSKMRNSQGAMMDGLENGRKRRRQFVEVIFPLANEEQLALVNDQLKDDGFRTEIEKVFRSLINHEEGKGGQDIPLDDILDDNLIRKLTWDNNEDTSLKNYTFFTTSLFSVMNMEWLEFENVMQKTLNRMMMQERCESGNSSTDFVIIPPPKRNRKSESPMNTFVDQNEVILETPQVCQEVEETTEEVPQHLSEQENEDSQEVVCGTDDESSNMNDFEQILPIKTKEEFVHMETLLTDKHFSTYFGLLCGNCEDRSTLLSNIITENALRFFTWTGTAETLCFQDTILCNILARKAYESNPELLKSIIDSVEEKALTQDVGALFPIFNKSHLKTVESYLPHIRQRMIDYFADIRQNVGNEVLSHMFSGEMISNSGQYELESLPKSPFFKEVVQVVFKDLRKSQIMNAIRDEIETPEAYFRRILPVSEINLGTFEQKLRKREFLECLIAICCNFVQKHTDGYFHKLIDSELIQQYSFNGEDGLRSIDKSALYNLVLKEVYKKSDIELQAKIQMELYLAQALADYKSDKLQS